MTNFVYVTIITHWPSDSSLLNVKDNQVTLKCQACDMKGDTSSSWIFWLPLFGPWANVLGEFRFECQGLFLEGWDDSLKIKDFQCSSVGLQYHKFLWQTAKKITHPLQSKVESHILIVCQKSCHTNISPNFIVDTHNQINVLWNYVPRVKN